MNGRDKPVIRLRGATDEAVVAVTASALTHETERYRAAGMDGCLAKPIDIRHLVAELQSALAASPRLAAA